jgi:hypothetical protein
MPERHRFWTVGAASCKDPPPDVVTADRAVVLLSGCVSNAEPWVQRTEGERAWVWRSAAVASCCSAIDPTRWGAASGVPLGFEWIALALCPVIREIPVRSWGSRAATPGAAS